MEKLILHLQKVRSIWFTDFAIRISFCFEKIHERIFVENYKMQLDEWLENINKNLEVKILMTFFRRFDYYEISFDFSFSLFRRHSYNEIENLLLKLFSKVKSISEIEKPFEFIDAFVDNFLSEEKSFMECIDSESFMRKISDGVINIREVGIKLYEMIKSTFRILFDDNDMKLYLEGKLEL